MKRLEHRFWIAFVAMVLVNIIGAGLVAWFVMWLVQNVCGL